MRTRRSSQQFEKKRSENRRPKNRIETAQNLAAADAAYACDARYNINKRMAQRPLAEWLPTRIGRDCCGHALGGEKADIRCDNKHVAARKNNTSSFPGAPASKTTTILAAPGAPGSRKILVSFTLRVGTTHQFL